MITILTALENEKINNQLEKIEEIKVISKDIQYKEGILEVLEYNNNINYIFFNNNTQGNISTEELLEKIRKINNNIKIILFLDKKDITVNINKYNTYDNIYKIKKINNLNLKTILNILNLDKLIYKTDENNKNKIINLKNIKKIKLIKTEKINKLLKKIKKAKKIQNNEKEKHLIKNTDILKKCLVLYFIGSSGIGKSMIISNLAKTISLLDKKILIIDLDKLNNSIHTILGVKKSQNENQIININNNIHILNINENINNIEYFNKLNLKIIKLRKKYDYILIDNNTFDNYLVEKILYKKEIINNSDYIICVSGCNLLEINKTSQLLDKYINKIKIEKNKIIFLFNKYSAYSINNIFLKKIFSEFNIVGFIKYNEKYNTLINKNLINFNINKKIKQEYINLINSIENIKGGNAYGNRK